MPFRARPPHATSSETTPRSVGGIRDTRVVDTFETDDPYAEVVQALASPEHLWSRQEVLTRPSPVPAVPGVYAWYFDRTPSGVPTESCHAVDGWTRLYVGISPGRPRNPGEAPSTQDLRKRIRDHFRGNASGSTLRLTLGCLLSDELGLELRRTGRTERMTWVDGESELSAWMDEHARVVWAPHPKPWLPEHELIGRWVLPLNLDQNAHSPFRAELSARRSAARAAARELPVV